MSLMHEDGSWDVRLDVDQDGLVDRDEFLAQPGGENEQRFDLYASELLPPSDM